MRADPRFFHPLCRVAGVLLAVAFVAFHVPAASAGPAEFYEAACRISTTDGLGRVSYGSGCCWRAEPQGWVALLTAAHVVGKHDVVGVEFWKRGGKSAVIFGQVWVRQAEVDAAVVLIPARVFRGVLPKAIPLAAADPRAGETIVTVGCPMGGQPNGVQGRVVGYQRTAIPGAMMLFEPFPAQGRSGSAIADAAGSRIVGLLYGRSADGPPWYGMATSITAILRGINAATEKTAFRLDPRVAGQAEIEEPQCAGGQCQARGEGRRETGVEDAQCAGGQCYGGQYDPDFFRGRLFGRQAPQPQQPAVPWPNQPPASSVDLAPVVGALQGGFNSMAEAIRGQPPSAPAQGAHDPALLHALQQIGQTAAAADRKADQAIGQVAEVGKKVEAVAGQVDSLHEAIAEGGTLRQRLALKKQELEEEGALEGKGRLGQDLAVLKATLREKHWWVAVVVVIGAVLVVLVAKDIRHKRQTGDPLEIAKLVRRLRGVRKVARAGVGAAAVANPALLPAAAAAGAADKGLDALHRRLDALSAQVNQVALQTPPK